MSIHDPTDPGVCLDLVPDVTCIPLTDAVIFVFVYPLGIPLLYLTMLWSKRDLIDPVVDRRLGRINVDRKHFGDIMYFRCKALPITHSP